MQQQVTELFIDEDAITSPPIEGFSGEMCYYCGRKTNELFIPGCGYWCGKCGTYNRQILPKPLHIKPDWGVEYRDILVGYDYPHFYIYGEDF